jgi:hypothetical protein
VIDIAQVQLLSQVLGVLNGESVPQQQGEATLKPAYGGVVPRLLVGQLCLGFCEPVGPPNRLELGLECDAVLGVTRRSPDDAVRVT